MDSKRNERQQNREQCGAILVEVARDGNLVNVAAMEGVARDGDDWNGESYPRYKILEKIKDFFI
ncbi:MAG: hypothetical protein K6F15_06465 [Treponema sp.]|nr:hypothetical protein [Treponema sp.]